MASETTTAADAATENFADLLAESFGEHTNIEGSVVRGFVIGLEGDAVIIDVGLKSEGRVPMKELTTPGQEPNVNVGDEIEVYVERMEDKNGQAVLSRDKARREEAWGLLEASFEKQERVTGVIFGKVKGGFTVDLSGPPPSFPEARSTFGPSATSARSWAPRSPSRSSRSTAAAATSSCRAGPFWREPRRSPFGAGIEPPGRSGPSGCGQEHHRLRRLRRSWWR